MPANWTEKEVSGGIMAKVIGMFLIGIIGIIGLFSSFFVVGAGERGVVFSQLSGTEAVSYGEGLHFKTPFLEKSVKLDVRTRKHETIAGSASKDLQVVSTTVALNYHINPESAHVVFQEIGKDYENRVIDPSIQEVVKATTARYNAEELITKRELVKNDIKDLLRERLASSNILLDEVSITNFDFSEEFNRAIEAKVTAEQNALKEQNNLKVVEFQAQQKVAQARGDAEAIQIINEQLLKSPQYVSYLTIEKWNGVMPLALGSGNLLSITPSQGGA